MKRQVRVAIEEDQQIAIVKLSAPEGVWSTPVQIRAVPTDQPHVVELEQRPFRKNPAS